jgi:hypothetical protein
MLLRMSFHGLMFYMNGGTYSYYFLRCIAIPCDICYPTTTQSAASFRLCY